MSSLRPLSARLRRRSTAKTVETLTELLDALTRERQDLRASGAGSLTLERNRQTIAQVQWELSYALIARYLAPSVQRNAA
jgi:hypothetical protein